MTHQLTPPEREKTSPAQFRFHVLALPHLVTSTEYVSCAYTQKVVKFCKMMKQRGHTVLLYAHARSEAECDELIPVVDDRVLVETYGSYDWRRSQFQHDTSDLAQRTFNANAMAAIGSRKRAGDFLLCFWGVGHRPVAEAHPDLIAVEPGIGYHSGVFANFRVFESYSVRDIVYEKEKMGMPGWYDAVIPNFFDPDDFEYREQKEDYFLYLGRLIELKGIGIAVQAAELAGVRLKIAGQGDYEATFGPVPGHVELVGFADQAARRELMAGAKALYVPSCYVEPFGGVMIEAFFSGTPVISTDWGSFAENNLHGITGWRCRTMEQFVWATKNAGLIRPAACREWAEENFTLARCALAYEEYFRVLQLSVANGGWYYENPERTELDWLRRRYPRESSTGQL